MEMKAVLAQNLSMLRKEKKISQRDMANLLTEKLNTIISNSSISHWEKGDYVPSVDVIFAYCDILGVSPNDIYGVKENTTTLNEREHLYLTLSSLGITKEKIDALSDTELNIVLQNAKSLILSFNGGK